MSNTRQVLPLALIGSGLILLGILAFLWLRQPTGSSSGNKSSIRVVPAQVDFPAPQLLLNDLAENPVTLSDYTGTVVLVNNWATWCPPCEAEMPTLEAYFRDHRSEGFTIVAIDAGEPREVVAEFVRQRGLTFPVWLDPGFAALEAFRNDALPSSYLVDRKGQVRLAWSGPISRDQLEKYVTPLLEE
jgi:thiol-disulfide isomerase/thioredoxin